MALDVEALWVALHRRLTDECESFVTVTRRRLTDPPIESCPVLMVLDDSGSETIVADSDGMLPAVWQVTGELVIVGRANHEETSSTAMNALVKEVRTALERQATESVENWITPNTDLGGLVRTLRITRVEKGVSGEKTGQAVALLTIEMEALG